MKTKVKDGIFSITGGVSIGADEKNGLNDLYREMVNVIGYENTMTLYSYYKGQQITFPTRLYKPEYVKKVLKQQYNGKNMKALARAYGYSERWIRELIKKED